MTRGMTGRGGVWRGLCVAPMLVLAVASSWPDVAAGKDIQWRSGPAELRPAEVPGAIAALAARTDARHVVAQFDEPVGSAQRDALRQAGLNLLRPLGGGTYFAALSADGVDAAAVQAAASLDGLGAIDPAWKLDPRILAGEVPLWAVVGEDAAGVKTVGVYILFHPDVPLFTDAVDAVTRHRGVVRDDLESINGLVVELPESEVEALAAEDVVQWIEWPLPPMDVVNNSNRVITEADIVQASPYNLDGSGVTVLVYDGGTARATHVDFQGRLTVRDGSGMNYHSTHVAGTIGGAGVANSAYKGMAPGVTMVSYGFQYNGSGIFLYTNPGDIETDYSQAISTFGAVIANNSIGTNTETNGFPCSIQGDYGVTAQLIDTIVRGDASNPLFTQPFRIVWANGNERQGSRCDVEGYGDYYSTAPPACAKNHITVGALNSNNDSMTSFSSWGPVDDGRMKPDLSAPGCQSSGDFGVTSCNSSSDTSYTTLCGTSMASPTVCGLSALLLEDFRVQFPAQPDPRNSTVKALLAHNATDLLNTGPDHQTGYGSVRIAQTIDFMRTANFFEAPVDQSGIHSVLVLVNPSDTELKVTLAWDDYPGTPNVNPALVNDLDLRVFDPSSQQHYPWTLNPTNPGAPAVRTQANHVDNLEQVLVNNPAPGVWHVEVYGFSVPEGPQTFSLCASPQLASCSSEGTIALDAPLYSCTSTVEIGVVDCDLNTDDNTIETVTVTIASDTEPGGETVLLTETDAATADFRGTIDLDASDSAGVLQVAEGDTVTATYIDADDGQGGFNVPVIATAGVDCAAPVITNVQIAEIGLDYATVTFDTDEPATGTVRYGQACAALSGSASEATATTSHQVELTGLNTNTLYHFAVDAVDDQGNLATDDNGGSCYSFSTPNVVYYFPLETDPGWTVEGRWTFGQPTGGGTHNGDPTEGYTGGNVYGYNLDGDYGNLIPAHYLTTTALDCSGLINVELRFWKWLGVEASIYDQANVQVSNDGSSWTTLWEHAGNSISDTSWSEMGFDISSIADGSPTVYVRWGMGPTDTTVTYPGWNIDDVQIWGMGSQAETCTNGIQDQGEDRIDCGGPCPPCGCLSDGACDDGSFCSGVETCDAFGQCQVGGDPCPGQLCDEDAATCVDCFLDPDCDDPLYCNGSETCVGGSCQAGVPVDCGDGVGCTDDSCNEATDSCDNVANDGNCDDGLFCNGAETCDALLDCQAGTAVDCDDAISCTVDSCNETTDSCDNTPDDGSCDDALFCDGAETCDPFADCQAGTSVDCDDGVGCTTDSCNEATDSCDNLTDDAFCDDGLFCTGAETCDALADCQPGSDPCSGDGCDEDNDVCVPLVCDDDGICESGEDCTNCPGDCFSGGGPDCGDGVCEAGDGEDCVSCPQDCNGKQTGKPSGRYCCGDGDGENPVGCGDPLCTAGGNTCSDVPTAPSCCGDLICEGGENSFNCEIDCGPPPCGDASCDPGAGEDPCTCPADCGAPPPTETNCTDAVDEDCDGAADCDDPTGDCDGDPACACLPRGDACTADVECCSNKCRGGSCK